MPTVTPAQVRTPHFVAAASRISEYRKYPAKKVMRIVKWEKAVQKLLDDINSAHRKFLKSYAELDENGDFIPMDERPGTWKLRAAIEKNPAEMTKYFSALDEYNKIEVEANVMPLQFSEVSKVELSPAEINALGELLTMGGEEE